VVIIGFWTSHFCPVEQQIPWLTNAMFSQHAAPSAIHSRVVVDVVDVDVVVVVVVAEQTPLIQSVPTSQYPRWLYSAVVPQG